MRISLLRDLMVLGIGLVAGAVVFSLWPVDRVPPRGRTRVEGSIEATVRNIGELVVMKAVLKEIVTTEINRQDLSIPKKAALIFKFDLNFKYDLREKRFSIQRVDPERVHIVMPPVKVDFHIRDLIVYDKQPGQKWFQTYPITVQEENELIQEARATAEKQVGEFVAEYRAQYRSSAESILKLLAEGFGYRAVTLEFLEE
jgi:hypothetical protein